ncbi:Condensation domain protein [Labrenzia sp. THAF82]|nr:Condensation domain protein [Labrenzia sp. THAF82]
MAKFDVPPTVSRLRSALRQIHNRHPMMRARIEGQTSRDWVVDVPFEKTEIAVHPAGEAFDVEAFYTEIAKQVLDISNVSWRAYLVTGQNDEVTWIALVTNHGGIDGRSALVILNDLDHLLQEPETWQTSTLPMTAPVEEGLAARGFSGDRSILSSWPKETNWPVNQPADSSQRVPYGFLRILRPETLSALHACLKQNGLHLASAFGAAAVKAASVLPGGTGWTGIVAPTDVRDDCLPAISHDAVGEYVAGITLLLGPEYREADTLEIARALQTQFTEHRPPSLLMDADVPLAVTLATVDQMSAANTAFVGGICVTDVGDLERLSGRAVGYSEVLLMPSQNHGIHPVLVAIVSTAAGVCLSFGYSEPLQTGETAHAFADSYVNVLEALAAGDA